MFRPKSLRRLLLYLKKHKTKTIATNIKAQNMTKNINQAKMEKMQQVAHKTSKSTLKKFCKYKRCFKR
jgi:uncharacterized protein YdbL (DUF1318 family)